MLQQNALSPKSSIDGLWVLLVANEGQFNAADSNGRVPMMARTGDDETYLLGFKNAVKARQFVNDSALEGAEPRMVVRANKDEYLRIARAAGVSGILVDYDAKTQEYGAATELY